MLCVHGGDEVSHVLESLPGAVVHQVLGAHVGRGLGVPVVPAESSHVSIAPLQTCARE